MIGRGSSLSWPGHLGALSVPVFILSGAFLTAQEALQTALDADKSARARQLATGGDAERIKAGPVQFNLGLSYEVEFTDNVNSSEVQRESDLIQRPQLDVRGFLPVTKTGRLSLGFGIGYEFYANNPNLNNLFLHPDSELAYDVFVKDFVFTFYDNFDYSREVETVGALSGVAQLPRFENTIGTRMTWAPSQWTYQAGYAHFNYISDGGDFSYLDRASEQFYARMAYGFAPETQVGVEATVALTDYASETRADNRSYSAGPYTEWRLTEWITLSLHGGLTYYDFDAVRGTPSSRPTSPGAASYSLDTYYGNVQIDHRLTRFISHGLSVLHGVQPGVNQGSDYVESTTANYHASWSITRQTTLGMSLFYERGTEPQDGSLGAMTEEFERLGAGVSGSHQLSDHLTVNLSYNYMRRTSNEPGRNSYENRASIAFRYQF